MWLRLPRSVDTVGCLVWDGEKRPPSSRSPKRQKRRRQHGGREFFQHCRFGFWSNEGQTHLGSQSKCKDFEILRKFLRREERRCTKNQMVAYYLKVLLITHADRESPGGFCFREQAWSKFKFSLISGPVCTQTGMNKTHLIQNMSQGSAFRNGSTKNHNSYPLFLSLFVHFQLS